MTRLGVAELIAAGRIERVPADDAAARGMLASAHTHLVGAAAIDAVDPDGAFSLAYDAARKAVTAHMLASGLRPRNRLGAHQAVVHYATAELLAPGGSSPIGQLDRLRRRRNQSEYGSGALTQAEARYAIDTAAQIVAVVVEEWPT